MTNTWDSFIDSLVEAPEPIETKPSRNEKTYPCGQCAGTGLFQGVLIHQTKKQCFSCRGRGYFKTDPRKLQQQREARAAKKEQAIKAAQEANKQTGLLTHFEQLNMISWNDFARSMYEQHVEGKLWSEKQVAVALSMIEGTKNRTAKSRDGAFKSIPLATLPIAAPIRILVLVLVLGLATSNSHAKTQVVLCNWQEKLNVHRH